MTPQVLSFTAMDFKEFSWLRQFSGALHQQKSWGASQKDTEDVKRIFMDTNKIFLYVISEFSNCSLLKCTVTVAVLHLALDLLAFKVWTPETLHLIFNRTIFHFGKT